MAAREAPQTWSDGVERPEGGDSLKVMVTLVCVIGFVFVFVFAFILYFTLVLRKLSTLDQTK